VQELERVVVEALGEQVERRREVLAGDLPVRARTAQPQLADGPREQPCAHGLEHALQLGGSCPASSAAAWMASAASTASAAAQTWVGNGARPSVTRYGVAREPWTRAVTTPGATSRQTTCPRRA